MTTPRALPLGLPLLVPLLPALLAACAAAATAPGEPPPPGACRPEPGWHRPGEGATVAHGRLLRELAGRRVVLLGEQHETAAHHRWQLSVLAGLRALREDLVLGLEMFPPSAQPALDRWVAGELTPRQLLREAGWERHWNFDPALYLPLFEYARLHRIPMLALNAEREAVARVRRGGWEALEAAERERLGRPVPAPPAYLRLLAASFLQHAGRAHGEEGPARIPPEHREAFRRFVDGQLLWDRAMARAIADALERRGPSGRPPPTRAPLVVALMGGGHLMHRLGVPRQLEDLGVKETAVLMPWEGRLGCEQLERGYADAVFVFPPLPEDPPPRLGVYLEPRRDGVAVRQVVPGSVAERAGLRPGDLLVEVAGRPVRGLEQVVRAVRRMPPGAWLPLAVERDGRRLELTARFPPAP